MLKDLFQFMAYIINYIYYLNIERASCLTFCCTKHINFNNIRNAKYYQSLKMKTCRFRESFSKFLRILIQIQEMPEAIAKFRDASI